MGDGFGQITDDGVAFRKQPIGNARHLGRPKPQFGCSNGTFGAATRQDGNGPDPVGFRRGLEILGQGHQFCTGFGGAIKGGEQGCEALHASSPASVAASSPV